MHTFRRLLPVSALFLAACTGVGSAGSVRMLDNPLYAEWYYKDLVENMMNLEIQADPITQDPELKPEIETIRREALRNAQEATARRQEGKNGSFRAVTQPAQGQVLLIGNTLYLGPDTNVMPGPDLRLYVSPVQDPLAGTGSYAFPDASAIDLGPLRNPYGADIYVISGELPDVRSVVLFDAKLKKIYGFTQMQLQ